ncbi:lysophospholipid acyltransferase family protein [Haliea sp. E1-2-M8]|uniref:lysophospholipid acyltransferase family protein n=1 Tax=Haliea sp. E1-2-M8 TaxID=3064706 RepID=UPI00271ADE50|nr:lysophospholipid acyltransferase family protein [Haliea sp. E1-2-M8]MDO8860330.1 lysophospholipid acyltransferase family protein [Haliea sp. E1-2-M8]
MALSRAQLLIGLIRLLSKLSLPAAQRLGRTIGTLASWLPTRSRRVTEINLRLCFPELGEAEQRQLVGDSLRHTGQVALEIPLIWEWPVPRCLDLIREIDGEELLAEARASGKGLLLLAPHLGNWELAGLYFSTRYRMAALYSPPSLPGFEDYMTAQRGRQDSELVPGDRRGLARLIGILREGEVAGILPDQSPKGSGSAFAPFFGIEIRTMTLVSKLLQKSGATPLMTWCQRLPDGSGFRLVVRRCAEGMAAPDPVVATSALNRSVEACVREAPEQYQWEYKRFRHRPPGQPNPYQGEQQP